MNQASSDLQGTYATPGHVVETMRCLIDGIRIIAAMLLDTSAPSCSVWPSRSSTCQRPVTSQNSLPRTGSAAGAMSTRDMASWIIAYVVDRSHGLRQVDRRTHTAHAAALKAIV